MLFPGRALPDGAPASAPGARALVALERKTWDAPLGDAYRAGAVSSLQALTILPVVAERTAAAGSRAPAT
jgi:hypothetical protein